MTVLAFVVFLVGFVVALVGVIVPLLPGVPVAAVGALLAAWILGFERFGVPGLVYVGLLTALAQLVDLAGGWLGARVYGAGRAGLWGGIVGSFVGLFFFPPFGFLVGALLGAVAFELIAGRELAEAFRAGVGAFVGTLGGVVAKLLIVVAIGVVVFPRLA